MIDFSFVVTVRHPGHDYVKVTLRFLLRFRISEEGFSVPWDFSSFSKNKSTQATQRQLLIIKSNFSNHRVATHLSRENSPGLPNVGHSDTSVCSCHDFSGLSMTSVSFPITSALIFSVPLSFSPSSATPTPTPCSSSAVHPHITDTSSDGDDVKRDPGHETEDDIKRWVNFFRRTTPCE